MYVEMGLGALIPAYFCMLFSNARHKPRFLFYIFAFLYALGAIITAVCSAILLLGLGYLKIDYKSWFKYIWIFVVAAFVALLVLATIVRFA